MAASAYDALVSDSGPLDPFEGDEPDPDHEPDPFSGMGMGMFGDLSRLFSGSGQMSWDSARQFAVAIATGGEPETNVDPATRMRLEDLLRVAEMHVTDVTGLPLAPGGRSAQIRVVNRSEWARNTLDDYRPLLEKLAESLTSADQAQPGDDDPAGQLFGGLMKMLAPMMLAITAGSMAGHLARRAFGDYELPIPRGHDDLSVLATNIDEFARQWGLDTDSIRLWILIEQLTQHAVVRVPHVSDRLEDLLNEFVGSFSNNPDALEDRLSGMSVTDVSDIESLQRILGDPEVILGAIQSDRQKALLPEIASLTAVVVGVTDHVLDEAKARLMGESSMLIEALRRRRVEASSSDRFVEKLLGIEVTSELVERGQGFVNGVIERSGPEALSRLWSRAENLPTPNEVDAPGLWLARLDLEL